MATAVIQQLREAIATILAANATVASLCGGTARVVDRNTVGPAVTLPAVAYEVRQYSPATGRAEVLLTGLSAASTDAQGAAWELVDAARQALTWSTFAAEALDVALGDGGPDDVNEVGLLDLNNPNLRQADWSLPLTIAD